MKIYQIYGLYCPFTDELKYIGATSKKLKRRLIEHIQRRTRENNKRCDWLLSLGDTKPIIKPIDICDESNWEEKERYWIAKYREDGISLFNNSGGGKGPLGARYTKAYVPQPKDKVAKRMASMAITLAVSGKKSLPNSRGVTTEIIQYTKDGIFIAEHKTTSSAARESGVKRTAITENLRGANKSAGGYVWRFKHLK